MDVVGELCLSTIQMAQSAFPRGEPAHAILKEMTESPFTEAVKAMDVLVRTDPSCFATGPGMTALGGEFPNPSSDSLLTFMRFSVCVCFQFSLRGIVRLNLYLLSVTHACTRKPTHTHTHTCPFMYTAFSSFHAHPDCTSQLHGNQHTMRPTRSTPLN